MKKIILATTVPFTLSFMKGQSAYLKQKGFDVYLFCSNGMEIEEYIKNEGCTYIEIPYCREVSLFSDLKCLFLTYKHIKEINPDIINAGTPKAGLLCMTAATFAGVKNRIFTLRGLRSTAIPNGLKKMIVECMEKLTHKLAVKIISISPSMTQYTIDNKLLDKDKVIVLGKASSNGVDINRFNPENKKHTQTIKYKDQFGILDSDIVLGYVGRIVKSKGIEELYQTFTLLSEKYENLKFLVVGPLEQLTDSPSGAIMNEMENKPSVIFAGRILDIEYIYPLMHIFSLPSHNFREGFGNVAIEASASGVPIIVSDGGGCQDAVSDGETGFLVNAMDVLSLKEAVEKYLKNENLRKEHGNKGRVFIEKYFTNHIIWEAQYQLYKSFFTNKQ